MYSVSTAPPISPPTCRPMMVITGIKRVAQRMQADDAPRRQALGARRAHIILVEHLEHRGARHARDDRERNGAEHDGGQGEMAQGRPEGALLIRQQRIDQHEAGDRLEVVLDEVDSSRYRRPAETFRKEHHEQEAPPEDRHGIAGERHAHEHVIIGRAPLDRGDGAGRNADADRQDQSAERELERRREEREEFGQHLLIGDDRGPEIPVKQLPHIDEELFPYGQVEAELMTELGETLGRYAVLADPDLDGIARHQPDRDEGHEHQRHESGQRQCDPADEEPDHLGFPRRTAPISGRRRRIRAGREARSSSR